MAYFIRGGFVCFSPGRDREAYTVSKVFPGS